KRDLRQPRQYSWPQEGLLTRSVTGCWSVHAVQVLRRTGCSTVLAAGRLLCAHEEDSPRSACCPSKSDPERASATPGKEGPGEMLRVLSRSSVSSSMVFDRLDDI